MSTIRARSLLSRSKGCTAAIARILIVVHTAQIYEMPSVCSYLMYISLWARRQLVTNHHLKLYDRQGKSGVLKPNERRFKYIDEDCLSILQLPECLQPQNYVCDSQAARKLLKAISSI